MKKVTDSMLYSIVVSLNKPEEHELTAEDIIYSKSNDVSNCQILLYRQVIKWLNEGKSYEEIYDLIDNLNMTEFSSLSAEKQSYLNKKLRKDISDRQQNQMRK